MNARKRNRTVIVGEQPDTAAHIKDGRCVKSASQLHQFAASVSHEISWRIKLRTFQRTAYLLKLEFKPSRTSSIS